MQQVWSIPCHVGKKYLLRKIIPSGCVLFKSFNLKKKSHPTWMEHPTHKGFLFFIFFWPPNLKHIYLSIWFDFPPKFLGLKKKSAKPSLGSWTVSHFGSRRHRIPWNWIPWSSTILIHQDTVLLNQLELPAIEYKLGLAPSHCDALRKMGGGGFLPEFCHLHHQEDKIWPL